MLSRCGATYRHVSGSFHISFEILFNCPSGYLCAIGLWTYLGLGGLYSRIQLEILIQLTLFVLNHHVIAYGPVALFGILFQAVSAKRGEVLRTPHLRPLSKTDSARPLPVSFAITSGIAFAFFSCPYYDVSLQGVPVPRPNRWVPEAPGEPGQRKTYIDQHSGTSRVYRDTKSHSAISGSQVACASPEHIVACHGLLRRQSQVIPMPAYTYRTVRMPEKP